MSYEERCKLLDWPTLSIRRDYLSLIECYKIVFGINENINFATISNCPNFLVPDQIIGSNCTSNQQESIISSTPFFIRILIVILWNILPTDTVEAADIGTFKRNLRLHLGM